MPLSDKERAQGWIYSEQLTKLSRQKLAREHAEAFLDWLFVSAARKPAKVRLNEGARVARFLKASALSSRPEKGRQLLMLLAESIWRLVLEVAPIKISTKQEAILFLARHAKTYLEQLNTEAAIKLIRKSKGMRPGSDFFRPPKLVSRTGAVQGPGGRRVVDDLSERICAAYHALRQAGVHGASSRVANALNRHDHRTHARAQTSQAWGAAEVYERVKQYDRQLKASDHVGQRDVQHRRDLVVDKWILLWRALTVR